MASSAFPSVIAAVYSVAAAAAPTARVVRGRDVSDDPGDVVMIGVNDPDEIEWDSAGEFQQTMQTFGGNREEIGTVNGLVAACDGDGDQGAALTTAFGYLVALEAAVRADPTLGLTSFNYVVAEFQAGQVSESQNDAGANAALSFTIAYKIRI